jgi:hypothetical protein
MSFFKVVKVPEDSKKKNTATVIYNSKIRYIIGDGGIGYWVRPLPELSIDYDKEIPF